MSTTRLCIAGVLIASGLTLALFTLQGYFDPQWAEKQSVAATAPANAAAFVAPVPQGRSRFVEAGETPASASRASARPPAQPPSSPRPQTKTVAASPPPSKPPRKKVVEKSKAAASQQQASFQWPWNLFNN